MKYIVYSYISKSGPMEKEATRKQAQGQASREARRAVKDLLSIDGVEYSPEGATQIISKRLHALMELNAPKVIIGNDIERLRLLRWVKIEGPDKVKDYFRKKMFELRVRPSI